jgi:hypothetical protein
MKILDEAFEEQAFNTIDIFLQSNNIKNRIAPSIYHNRPDNYNCDYAEYIKYLISIFKIKFSNITVIRDLSSKNRVMFIDIECSKFINLLPKIEKLKAFL